MTAAMGDELFLRACRREVVERTPVWLMRQAGRYLPSYRAVRSKVGFLELCKTPDLATEVTLAAVRDLDVDAAILFSDILVPVEAMGMVVQFTEEHGPQLPVPLRDAAAIDKLRVADPEPPAESVMVRPSAWLPLATVVVFHVCV